MEATSDHVHRRKRKKSFIKKQKQYGKKGRFGQGVQLSEEEYQYFIRIFEVMKSSKDNREDMETLANNVLEEIKEKEVDTCSNQLASRVIEELLPYAPHDKICGLVSSFGSAFRLVFTDPYCSHVLQKLTVILTQRLLSKADDKEKEILEQLQENFLRIAKFALNNLEDFIFDTYANHILRTLFACVNGRPVKEESVGLDIPTSDDVTVPEVLNDLAVSFTEKMASWPQLSDLTLQVLPSGCLQALLLSIRGNSKLSHKLTKKIVEICKTQDIDVTDESNSCLLHVIEATIIAAPPKYFLKLFTAYFKGKLKRMAGSKVCNFAVQKLFLHCPVKEYLEEMMAELDGGYDVLLDSNHTGILLAMAKSCRRLKTKEGEFSKNLFSSLHCEDPPERRTLTTPLIYTMTRLESFNENTCKVNLHGSLVVQEMLHFTKPIRIVTSLLNMEANALVSLLSDPRGCHIADAFCSSLYVGEKNREKLARKMEKHYAGLASSKHGSRTFDAIWSGLGKQHKITVMDELKSSQSMVVGTICGRVIASKVRLDLYRKDKDAWLRQIGASMEKPLTKKERKKIKQEKRVTLGNSEDYLKLGFTSLTSKGIEKPQLYKVVLSHESMKPSKLKRHLEKTHSEHTKKSLEFFHRHETSCKSQRLDRTEIFQPSNTALMQASYEVALEIAKQKKNLTQLEKSSLNPAC